MGVHFLLDVLAGWLIGLLLLWLFNKNYDRIQTRVIHWTKVKQWFGAIAVSGIMILIPGLIKLININWEIKPEYLLNIQSHLPDFELTPFSMDGVISAAAVVFGIFAGLILVHKIDSFRKSQSRYCSNLFPIYNRNCRCIGDLDGTKTCVPG